MAGINVPLTATPDQLIKDLAEGANAVRAAGATIKKDAAGVADSLDKAGKSGQTMAQAYRAASKEAQRLTVVYGEMDARVIAATKHAANLKDEFSDFNTRINALSPDAPFKAVGGVLQGVAGGFAAAQGAAALFGGESEAVAQTLLKVQAAMALSAGITSIVELKDAFIALNVVMAANPILAVTTAVVALGAAAYAGFKMAEEAALDLEAVEKRIIENEKAYADAVSKASQSILSTRELQLRASTDGYTKEAQALEIAKQKELATVRDTWEKSKQNYADRNRYIQSQLAIEAIYTTQTERLKTQSVVDNLNRQKVYYEAFGLYTGSLQEKILANELETYDKGSKAYLDKLNELKTFREKNAQELAHFNDKSMPIRIEPKFDALGSQRLKLKEISIDKLAAKVDSLDLKPINVRLVGVMEKAAASFKDLKTSLKAAAIDAGSSVMESLGASLAGGEANEIGAKIQAMLGEIASMTGKGLIAIGIPMAAVGIPEGFGYIAAGSALLLVAGALSASSSGGGSSGSGGGLSSSQHTGWSGGGGSFAGSGASNFSGSFNATTKLSGRDLQIVLARNNQITKRVK